MILQQLTEMIEELSSSSSSNNKKEVLKKYDSPEMRRILTYVYDDINITFGITSKNVKKKGVLGESSYELYELLDSLSNRTLTGNDAASAVMSFAESCGYPETFYRIIDRDLKCRTGLSFVNEVYDNYITTFDVALAESYYKCNKKNKPDFKKDKWVYLRKLDGLRCICIVKDGKASLHTRNGGVYTTLDVLKQAIEWNCSVLGIENMVFDGELCIVNEHGDEDFAAIQKVWNKKDYTIPNPKYKIFDMLTIEEFYAKHSDRDYITRHESLGESLIAYSPEFSTTSDLAKYLDWEPILGFIESEEHLEEEIQKAVLNGWEGLMLRKGCYTGDRSFDLLKVKKFYDEEYIVLGVETGMYQVVKNGTETEIETVTSLIIEHKGNQVNVGSGPKLWQRKEWFEDSSKIIGKTITVKYFETSIDSKTGKESLRFPTLKCVHGTEREV